MAVPPTVAEVKLYLQIPVATTTHDALIASLIGPAVAFLERASGRTISTSSNVETRYSTEGQSAVVIHDRPYVDPSRSVTFNGAGLTENTSVWFLQDRRSTDITAMVQLRQFTGRGEWWKADPNWFDRNLDVWAGRWGDSGQPNDLVINGVIGMPVITEDTKQAISAMTGHLFKQKDAVGNTTFAPEGMALDMSEAPSQVQQWITDWRIRTGVGMI